MSAKNCCLGILLYAAWIYAAEDYAQWRSYRTITINTTATGANVSVAQRNFPTLVRLSSANFDFSKALRTGADVRFAKLNGVHLPYQIEQWDSVGRAAAIWVLLDTVPGNSNRSFRMYYGKSGSTDSSNGAAVFSTSNNFQGVFHLGEATNDTARDVTVNRFKGVPRNTGGVNPVDTVGTIGRAKKFLGSGANNNGGSYQLLASTGGNTFTNNALNFQNDSATAGGNGLPQYTISAWIYVSEFPYTFNGHKAIVAKSAGPVSTTQYVFKLQDPAVSSICTPICDTMRIGFLDPIPALYKDQKPVNKPISVGNWYHAAAVRTGGVGDSTHLRVWINGYAFPPGSGITSTSMSTTTRQDLNVYIGSFSNDSGYFNGKMDEVRFESTARDSMWLKLSYETQKPGSNAVTVGGEAIVGLINAGSSLNSQNAVMDSRVIHADGAKPYFFRVNNGAAAVRMAVENMDGRVMWSRVLKPDQDGMVFWNGVGENGKPVSPGMYVVRMKAN